MILKAVLVLGSIGLGNNASVSALIRTVCHPP